MRDDTDRNDEDHEPCSTGGAVMAPLRPAPPSQILTKKLNSSSSELSPLRLALSTKTPPLSSSSSTPILTASLNRPPVGVSSAGIDLSSSHRNSNNNNNNASRKVSPTSTSSLVHQLMPKNDSRTPISAEVYANLLMQLRQVASNDATTSGVKLTAAARKERLKCQPCFQCPVCKKRFQRHIALNAHFQNEHIGQSSSAADSDKKICRLCSHVSSDMAAVRQHLVKQHNIDLENPASSLVEPEPSTTTTYNGDLIISRRSSPVTITTDANVELITSSSSSTPDRTSPVLGPVKIELIDDVEQEHAKDLSIRSHKQQQQQQQPEVVQVHRKRPASPAAVSVKLIKKAQKNSRAGHNDNHESDSNWQCQHCNITFPNQTLYFLHRGFHSETDPWRCNGCGLKCSDLYDFNTHLVSDPHR